MPSFYRVAKRFPPDDDEYRSLRDRRGDAPEHYPADVRGAWDALSAWDSAERARRAARRAPHLGTLIIRYDVSEGAGITWTPSLKPGHYSLRGDIASLKRCLVGVDARASEKSSEEDG